MTPSAKIITTVCVSVMLIALGLTLGKVAGPMVEKPERIEQVHNGTFIFRRISENLCFVFYDEEGPYNGTHSSAPVDCEKVPKSALPLRSQ
jgi:hypothetical protein